MKQIKTLIITATIASALVSLPPFLGVSQASEEAPISIASCEGECGYAVVDDAGVVHGVIVCQEGCFDGVMPVDYMGCPAGCSLVLQSPADSTGNVAGVHGPNVIYTPDNNTFSRVDDNGGSWTLIGGEPLDNAIIVAPPTTVAIPPEIETPIDEPIQDAPVNEEPPSTTTAPTSSPSTTVSPSLEESDTPELLAVIEEYLTQTLPTDWLQEVTPEIQAVIDEFYGYLRDIVLSAWPEYFSQELNAQ